MLGRVEVKRELRTTDGRLIQTWSFYCFDDGRVVLDDYSAGTVAPGKRKPLIFESYSRLGGGRSYFYHCRVERKGVPLPPDVRDEALAKFKSLLRFVED